MTRDDPSADPTYRATDPAYRPAEPAYTPSVSPTAPAYERRTYPSTTRTDVAAAPVVPDARDRTEVVDREPTPRFSIGATFLGWAVASFFTLVFATAVSAILGGNAAADGTLTTAEAQQGGIALLIGMGLAVLAAYVIGGYAAGRIALWNGAAHGAATVVWAVLFTVVAVLAGTALANYANVIPALNPDDVRNLTTTSVVGIIVAFVVAALGGALGGRLGERYHERHVDDAGYRGRYYRGRTV